MRKLLLLFFLYLTSSAANSQQLLWEQPLGTATKTVAKCEPLPQGGFTVLYVNGIQFSLARLDSLGAEVWQVPLDPVEQPYDELYCFLKAVPGGILIGGNQYGPADDTTRITILKYNWQGTKIWSKVLPALRKFDQPRDLYIRSANEYILFGCGTNTNVTIAQGGASKFLTIAIDSSGNMLRKHIYINPLTAMDDPVNIVPYRENGYLLTGRYATSTNSPRIIKTDSQGNALEYGVVTSPALLSNDYVTRFGNYISATNSTIVFTGYNSTGSSNPQDQYILVSKVDTALNVLWTVTHNEPGGNFISSRVFELIDSSFLLVTQNHFANQLILLKLSTQGQVVDTVYVPVTGATHATSLKNSFLLPDGSLIYGGRTFIAKIGNVGLPMPQPQFPSPVGLPEDLMAANALGLVYPNPARDKATIPYTLPAGVNKAAIVIADVVTGRVVYRQPLAATAGKAEVRIDLRQFANVCYAYTLVVDDKSLATRKMVVIK